MMGTVLSKVCQKRYGRSYLFGLIFICYLNHLMTISLLSLWLATNMLLWWTLSRDYMKQYLISHSSIKRPLSFVLSFFDSTSNQDVVLLLWWTLSRDYTEQYLLPQPRRMVLCSDTSRRGWGRTWNTNQVRWKTLAPSLVHSRCSKPPVFKRFTF